MSKANESTRIKCEQPSERDAALSANPCMPAKHLRLSFKGELARVFRLGRQGDGVSQRELADRLGVQRALTARFELGHEPHAPSVLHIPHMPSGLAKAVIRWQAAHHRLQVLASAEVRDETEAQRTARLTAECLELPRIMTADLADGQRCDSELEAERDLALKLAEQAREHAAWCERELQSRRVVR
jgi:transcriptional regulator with XRE-family HTH domain